MTPSDSLRKSARAGTSRLYRPELYALRFFPFLSVFSLHRMDYVGTDPVKDVWSFRIGTIGAFGVPVFFLLSAFLITDLLLRERERMGKIHIKAFYMRRILRNGLGTALALATTIALADMSYLRFERPFLKLKERFTFVGSRAE